MVQIPARFPASTITTPRIPISSTTAITADWTITPTTVLEVTYGSIENQLAGGGSGGVLVDNGGQPQQLLSAPSRTCIPMRAC